MTITKQSILALALPFCVAAIHHSPTCNEQSFDYVVVGSGPSGASIAFKLSEDPKNRVLLLEEGGYSLYPNKGVQQIWKGMNAC